jgi:adenine-specific DNA-methyltransferase
MLPTAEAAKAVPTEPASAAPTAQPGDESAFIPTIIDHLRKAGVQNTKKGERLEFDRLDAYPGEFLQAEGSYTVNVRSTHVLHRRLVCEFSSVGRTQPCDDEAWSESATGGT